MRLLLQVFRGGFLCGKSAVFDFAVTGGNDFVTS